MASIIASIQLFIQLLGQAKALWKFYQDNKTEAWFQDSVKTFDQLMKAKTTDEKKNAISDLAKLWGSV